MVLIWREGVVYRKPWNRPSRKYNQEALVLPKYMYLSIKGKGA